MSPRLDCRARASNAQGHDVGLHPARDRLWRHDVRVRVRVRVGVRVRVRVRLRVRVRVSIGLATAARGSRILSFEQHAVFWATACQT